MFHHAGTACSDNSCHCGASDERCWPEHQVDRIQVKVFVLATGEEVSYFLLFTSIMSRFICFILTTPQIIHFQLPRLSLMWCPNNLTGDVFDFPSLSSPEQKLSMTRHRYSLPLSRAVNRNLSIGYLGFGTTPFADVRARVDFNVRP